MYKTMICASLIGFALASTASFAQDLTGVWKQIDDKTGSPKALIEIKKDGSGAFSGKIIKITPRPGYTPKATCTNCPPPYKDQPILGLEVFKGLTLESENIYEKGKILDPLTGKTYNLKGKLMSNGKRLHLRGYLGISAIGRTQTWIRQD